MIIFPQQHAEAPTGSPIREVKSPVSGSQVRCSQTHMARTLTCIHITILLPLLLYSLIVHSEHWVTITHTAHEPRLWTVCKNWIIDFSEDLPYVFLIVVTYILSRSNIYVGHLHNHCSLKQGHSYCKWKVLSY